MIIICLQHVHEYGPRVPKDRVGLVVVPLSDGDDGPFSGSRWCRLFRPGYILFYIDQLMDNTIKLQIKARICLVFSTLVILLKFL